jgi:beta-phosphoglucomutase-like phosphatase (HAD superfamily)
MPKFDYDAVLFDLDGVLTSTTPLHAAAWKQAFDEALPEPFDIERDYLAHVDGTSRATRSWASSYRTSTSSSASAGTSRARRGSTTRCCCTTTRSSSTATR